MINELRQSLQYNYLTGKFNWFTRQKTGNIDKDGYLIIRFKGKAYKAHRLAWLYFYGVWPKNQIDHINGIRNDNRIQNLRDVTADINSQNRQIYRQGRLLGTSFIPRLNKWIAQAPAKYNLTKKYIGVYKTEQEANEAYQSMVWLIEEVLKVISGGDIK